MEAEAKPAPTPTQQTSASKSYFERQLEALECPVKAPDFSQWSTVKDVACWLEEQKIHAFEDEDDDYEQQRTAFFTTSEQNAWLALFDQYLKDLGCTRLFVSGASRLPSLLSWLISYALTNQYAENSRQYNDSAKEYLKFTGTKQERSHLDQNIDFESAELKEGVNALAATLGLPSHPDHKLLLEAILKPLQNKFNARAIQEHQDAAMKDRGDEKDEELKRDEEALLQLNPEVFPLGFDTGDEKLNKAATVLRLLYISDIRQLQTRVNELIVAVQNITANPTTDSKLGKVGK